MVSLIPHPDFIISFGEGWAQALIVFQLFLGSYLVFLLDELVSKWGIGSGISLFIAAGRRSVHFRWDTLPSTDGC
ncbi:MAG: hypothetical protein ACJZ59_05540 [Candidatus Thalassarchaeaceae archaeon]